MKVVTFNTAGAFANPELQDDMLDFVYKTKPDVAYFGESHWERWDRPNFAPLELDTLRDSVNYLKEEFGYAVTLHSDNDASDRSDRTGFMGIVKPELGSGRPMPAGTRDGYLANVYDPTSESLIRFGGVHFDDKDEATRLNQVAHLPRLDVLLGDLNAMERGTRVSKALRALIPFANMLPVYELDFNDTTVKDGLDFVRKYLHFGKRMIYMADGSTLQALGYRQGLHTADPLHRPTHRIAPIQIDHIMVREEIEVEDFTIHEDVKISDHKPLSANITRR